MNIACNCGGNGTCVPCLIKAQMRMSGKPENEVAREMAAKAVADSKAMRDYFKPKKV